MWRPVAAQELRDLWLSGRGMVLLFAFSVLVSAITYVGATSEGINFLEKRETVNLTLQVAQLLTRHDRPPAPTGLSHRRSSPGMRR